MVAKAKGRSTETTQHSGEGETMFRSSKGTFWTYIYKENRNFADRLAEFLNSGALLQWPMALQSYSERFII